MRDLIVAGSPVAASSYEPKAAVLDLKATSFQPK
jgi:hypothetical protein